VILDQVLPEYDATRIEHLTADAEPARAYAALLDADLMQAYRGSPSMRALFALREAPSALARRLRGEPPPPQPEALRLADLPDRGEWVKLGEEPGAELAFGAIGRFWGREIEWRRISAAEFRGFAEPGFGKVGASISVRDFGAGRSLLSYEARTLATDEEARRRFLRYWRLVSPGVGIVLRGTLSYLASLAEGRAGGTGPR
jgi:hypothetical protein